MRLDERCAEFTRGHGSLRRRNRGAARCFEAFQRERQITLHPLGAAFSERGAPGRITLGKRRRADEQRRDQHQRTIQGAQATDIEILGRCHRRKSMASIACSTHN